MVADFYVHVMSNSHGKDNKICSFTQRLPKKIEFNSSWRVGLANIIYPYSWPDLGVEEYQYIDVAWTTGVETRIWVKSTACRTVQDMIRGLQRALDDAAGSMCKQARKRKASSRRK